MQKKLLEELYIKHYKSVYLYTLSLSRHREMAEDIVSRAFEIAFTTLPDSGDSFQYWLMRVCRNLWIDALRRGTKFSDQPIEHYDPGIVSDTLNQLIKKEQHQSLYKSIQRLPAKQRELLTLYYFSEIPLGEIAEMSGISYGTAKTQLHRARLMLKKYLKEEDHEI